MRALYENFSKTEHLPFFSFFLLWPTIYPKNNFTPEEKKSFFFFHFPFKKQENKNEKWYVVNFVGIVIKQHLWFKTFFCIILFFSMSNFRKTVSLAEKNVYYLLPKSNQSMICVPWYPSHIFKEFSVKTKRIDARDRRPF